jgi:hypothetical protein
MRTASQSSFWSPATALSRIGPVGLPSGFAGGHHEHHRAAEEIAGLRLLVQFRPPPAGLLTGQQALLLEPRHVIGECAGLLRRPKRGLSTERVMSGRLTQHVVAACTGREPG